MCESVHQHRKKVGQIIHSVIDSLRYRANTHDQTKLKLPESAVFLRGEKIPPYGTEEYFDKLKSMGSVLAHHYRYNRHHPQHFENGLYGMTLIDLIEMLADWKAASQSNGDPEIIHSLDFNRERFHMDDQLYAILKNTIRNYGW